MHPGQKQLYYSANTISVLCKADTMELMKTTWPSHREGDGSSKRESRQPENWSRRANVTVVNIPEKSEGDDGFGYIIPRIFGEEYFPATVTIERAHCLGRAADGVQPILVKFLNYRDKDKVLRLARDKGTVYLDTNRVSFYLDYSIDMIAFNKVKKKL